ncbi:MAG: hypothetical protein HFI89_11010 [Lachnospiraceae bacterium]|nr:hypothetical protein [Lachnospiraceae bacterium]
MKKRTRNQYSYSALLACSLVIAAFAQVTGFVCAEAGKTGRCPEMKLQSAVHIPSTGSMSSPASGLIDMTANELADGQKTEGSREPAVFQADTSYFDDALFIGDSRTVGLSEYGNLGNAEVVADSGMNVHEIFDKNFATRSGEKKSLEMILSEERFGKIYLMLGINELGYDFDYTVAKYKKLVEKLRETQPDALIFLQANLHVTAGKSAASGIYNNENIDRFNRAIGQLADNRYLFYLDVNELFDDEGGNLAEEYTADNSHVLGIYYEDWVEWLLKHAYR